MMITTNKYIIKTQEGFIREVEYKYLITTEESKDATVYDKETALQIVQYLREGELIAVE